MFKKSMVRMGFIFILGAMMMMTNCGKKLPKPPVAKKIPKSDTLFGDVRVDNYYWLRDRKNPDVINYLKAENEYALAVMKDSEALQKKLYDEMLSRIKETDLSVPVKIDDYYYYTRTEEGKQYPIYCRKKGSLEAPEEVLLDQNKLAEGHDFCRLGVYKVSPNHRYLAYSVDFRGSETYTLRIKDLQTGELLPDSIPNTYYSVEWANNNRTLFYTTLDRTMRPYRLYRHSLGEQPDSDVLVFEEPDQAYYLSLTKTRSKAYLLINLNSMVTSEVWYLRADRPEGQFRVIHPRQHGMEYYVEHHGKEFYIVTNDNDAKNFKVMVAPVSRPGKKNWKEFIPHNRAVKIDAVDAFQNYLVVYQRENGLKTIRIFDFVSGKDHRIQFPEEVYTYWPGDNPVYNTDWLRFTYTSFITPRTVYDYNMKTRKWELKKRDEVLGGYDPNQYQSERVFAIARDGTKVPISLVYRKGLKKNGKNPLYLYGYGAYGVSIDPSFSSSRLSLLNRGFVYAIAHVRGGGEMGRYWYEDGKLLKKKNTFYDFIDCAEYLIKQKFTNPEKLVVSGGSAGGLLMGAVNNFRPDLFKVVLAHVPFVDVLNTMLDPTLPLTVIEYEEWGNPHQKEYYFYIKSYSPYDNVEAKNYPNMLVTAGLNDPRVSYWEPAKWVAKLRDLKTDHNLLLLKTKMGAGHSGASGRYDYLKDLAFEYAFVFKCLGIKE